MCFERLLQAFARWQPSILFDIDAQPILEYCWIDSYTQLSLRTQFKLQLSIRFTPSRCLDVRQDWYPMYYPEGMKARVSPVQSIEPHRILAPTRDLNQEPPGSESRVVTTIQPLHTSWDKYNIFLTSWHDVMTWRQHANTKPTTFFDGTTWRPPYEALSPPEYGTVAVYSRYTGIRLGNPE